MTATTPITVVSGVGAAVAAKLTRLGITTVRDLLYHFPRRYEDWTQPRLIRTLRIGEAGVVIHAEVVWIKNERSPRRRMAITKALVRDESGEMLLTWFNQPFLVKTIREGETYYFRGTVGFDRAAALKVITSPTLERIPRIQPIYGETAGVTSRLIRSYIDRILEHQPTLDDIIPDVILNQENLCSITDGCRQLHQPVNFDLITQARERFAFEELFTFSVRMLQLRAQLRTGTGSTMQVTESELRDFTGTLPFTLTDDQRRAAWEIIQDLGKSVPMNRLVEGDVGSGKTVVAAFAAYVAARAGYQTIWMAPTELLASQHTHSVGKLLQPFGIEVVLWTGSTKQNSAKTISSEEPKTMAASVTIGTHAVLSAKLSWDRVGLVIIDEQHRFGVEQRATLRQIESQESPGVTPHFLSMTATPIPRTLALALYGELDISLIRTKPADRLPIKTHVIAPDQRLATYSLIRDEVARGHQVYVICPLIEEATSDATTLFAELERKSVTSEYERLSKEIFPDLQVGLVHGRLKAREKQTTMDAFNQHKLDILVSTSVIEVGIDVPNATVMMIEGADRFGLAQLHQLRGRVGRGEHQSHCFLVAETWSPIVRQRLSEMEKSDDGFALAEADLRLRGPGELIGDSQSGFPEFRMASLMDFALIARARAAAEQVLGDPRLANYVISRLPQSEQGTHLE